MTGSTSVGDAWLWIGILIVVVIGAGLGMMAYRRRVLAAAQEENAETFMESLRRMRASGEMSEDEFQAVRRKLIGGLAGRSKPTAEGRRRGGDSGV